MHGEERTEQATPKRRKDAREKGQVAKSVDVNAAVGLLAGIYVLKTFGEGLVDQWRLLATDHFHRMATFSLTITNLREETMTVGMGFLKLTMPILVISMLAGLSSNFLQVGFMLSSKAMAPDFSRLNPLKGLTRMFSGRSAVELGKSAFKASVVGYVIATFFRNRSGDMLKLMSQDYWEIAPNLVSLCWELLSKTAIAILVIALADYAYQRWSFEKSLRMTKQEVKEEYKKTEGDPQIKGRQRQRQREMARNRMFLDVEKATVVVTNPTHFAVALRYDPAEMAAPVIVAKGQRLVAQKIKERAAMFDVPIVENKPLARTLYASCEIGEAIPAELYQAVAEIIAFVFKKTGRAG